MKKHLTLLLVFVAIAFASNAQVVVSTFDSVAMVDANGVPLFNNQRVQVTGIVYGPNTYYNHYGAVFFMANGSKGIEIYAKRNFGYTVTNGDSVLVIGTLTSYHGFAEISPDTAVVGDTIKKLGIGAELAPVVVTTVAESNEGQLIEIQNVNMTAAIKWGAVAGKHEFTAHSGNTYMYIDSFMNYALYNWPQPQGVYNVVGFGNQYASSATPPYTGGYSIEPRDTNDFILVSTGINDVVPLLAKIYPNPSNGNFLVFLNDNSVTSAEVSVMDIAGRIAYQQYHQVEGSKLTINAQNLTSGIYMVEVRSGDKAFRTKMVIEK